MTTKSKIIIGVLSAAGLTAILTRKSWILPYIKINVFDDKKIFSYKMYAGGHLVEGSSYIDSDSIKQNIGEYRFQIYPDSLSGMIQAFIYKGEDLLTSNMFNSKKNTAEIFNRKKYKDYLHYTNGIVAVSVIYMGLKLTYDLSKKQPTLNPKYAGI